MIRIEHGDVGRVGELDADLGDRRAERAHRERHDVHRAAAHRAARTAPCSVVAHLGRVAPVVGRAGVLLALGADERAVLDARDVARVRPAPGRSSGAWRRDSRLNVPASTSSWQSRSYSSAEPSHQWISSGWVSAAISSTQREPGVLRRNRCQVTSSSRIEEASTAYVGPTVRIPESSAGTGRHAG